MFKIFVDPGHGGEEFGAVNKVVKEKDINLKVALEIKRLCEKHKEIEVQLSRYTDTTVSLNSRCDMANLYGAGLFISIHHNAGGGDGYEVIHSIVGGKGKEFAHIVGKEFGEIGQNKRRIYYRESENFAGKDYYAVIRGTSMPAVITEYAFMDTKDFEAIDTNEELLYEAVALYKAICKFYKIEPVSCKNKWDELQLEAWEYLNDVGIKILEQRFNVTVTRGEMFYLLSTLHKLTNNSNQSF